MSMERARELLGFTGSYQRYPNVESVRDLSEISDPESLEDETAGSIRQWMSRHRRQTVALSLFAGTAAMIVLYFVWQYIPLIVTNRYVQAGGVAILIFLAGRRNGWRANQRRIEDIDEIAFHMSDDLLVAKGLMQEGGRERPPLAVPIKGYRKPGMRPRPYTIEEVDPQVLDRIPGSVDPDTPALIRMHPTYTAVTETATGRRAAQLTAGFEPVEDVRFEDEGVVVLRAAAPVLADEEEVRAINDLNEELAEEKKRLKAKKKELEQRVDDLMREVNRPMDERVETELERVRETLRAARGQGRRRREQENGEYGPRKDGTDDVREIVEGANGDE